MNRSSRGRKPYPWTCGNCRKQSVYEGATDYEHDLEFEGRTYHIALPGLRTPRCRECSTVLLDSDANEQITHEFFRLAGLLTPEQIRKNREILNLTQKQIATAIGVPEATVSHLENGDGQFQDRTLDNLLRLFFGVPKARDLLIAGNLNTVGLVANPSAMAST